MEYYVKNVPIPSDYFGVLWALSGIENAIVIEHGSTGNVSYNKINYYVMNRQSPQGKLFSSGLDEDDVVMGREERLISAIKELDTRFQPEIIFVVATSVTSIIGLDLDGIIAEIQPDVNAFLIAFPSGGFCGNYQWGIKKVYRTLFENVIEKPTAREPLMVNLIGPSIDTFNNPSDIAELRRLLRRFHIHVHTVFTAQTDVEKIRTMANVALNIVTRDVGLEVAELCQERFHIPYVYGLPFGVQGTVNWLKTITDALHIAFDLDTIRDDILTYGKTLKELLGVGQQVDNVKIAVSCPYDYALGLTRFIKEQWGLKTGLVLLPVQPEAPEALKVFESLGADRIVVEPTNTSVEEMFHQEQYHVLFGSYHDLQMAENVPIKLHAAFPSFDYLYMYDGTPFVGFRGTAYLTQLFINSINQHVEVLAR